MKELNRILVPTDFSEGSHAAYKYAQAVTDLCGGKINLIHIIPTLEYFNKGMKDVGYPGTMEKPKPVPEEEVMAWIEKDLIEYFDKEHQGEVIVKTGRKPYEEITREAEGESYDLIIMGKTGSHQSGIMGSITEKVVRHSVKPVLSVNNDTPPKEIKKLLVPTDYSNNSLQALHPATILASLMNGEITLLHVLEIFGTPANEHIIPEQDVEDAERMKLINRVDAYLQARADWDRELVWEQKGRSGYILLNDKSGEQRIPFSVVIQRGVGVHQVITNYAAEHADLILINTYGQSGFSKIFMGSTTERVIYQANKPVLSIRTKEEDENLVDE